MKRTALVTVVLALVAFAFAPVAMAQPKGKQEQGKKDSKTVKNYDFSGDEIDGELVKPDGDFLDTRKFASHTSLIRIRKDFIKETAPEFRKPTIEQLSTFVQPTWQALIDGALYCQPQLAEILARQRPDVIVEDNVNCFPALVTGGARFVRMVSCNPLEMRGPELPPVFSGYAIDETRRRIV